MAKKPTMKDKNYTAKSKDKSADKKAKMPAAGLTAAQKKLPPALQAAILKRKKK